MVRADGVVAHSGGKVVKNVAGYDLGKLFSGSQGTLGLITEVTFRLHPLPAAVAWVTGEFGAVGRGPGAAARGGRGGGFRAGALGGGAAGRAGPRGRLRVGVLLEGTPAGVADRAERMSELLAGGGRADRGGLPTPPCRWWGRGPAAGAPARWSGSRSGSRRWPGARRAGRGRRERGHPARGAAGRPARACCTPAWTLARRTPGRPVRPGVRDRLAVRLAGSADGFRGRPRGGVVVLAAPAAVRAAADAAGPCPGSA